MNLRGILAALFIGQSFVLGERMGVWLGGEDGVVDRPKLLYVLVISLD